VKYIQALEGFTNGSSIGAWRFDKVSLFGGGYYNRQTDTINYAPSNEWLLAT